TAGVDAADEVVARVGEVEVAVVVVGDAAAGLGRAAKRLEHAQGQRVAAVGRVAGAARPGAQAGIAGELAAAARARHQLGAFAVAVEGLDHALAGDPLDDAVLADPADDLVGLIQDDQ